MPELTWRHQTLIQALLSRGPLKEDRFHRIFTGLTGKNPGSHQQLYDDFLLKINKELSSVQLELRGCRSQYDGQVYYGVINNVSDDQSKLGTKYSVPQIAFYKAIVEAIVQDATAQGRISSIDALNLRLENQVNIGSGSQGNGYCVPSIRNFTISQKEKALNELVSDQWLSIVDGDIKLGIRSFLDLRSWFRSNDIPSCEVCNEAGVKAELCQNEACAVRIHDYCLKKLFSKRKGGRVCPGCGIQWKYDGPKMDLVEEEDDEANVPTQSQLPPRPKRKKQRIRNGNEPEPKMEFVEVDDDEANVPTQSQLIPRPIRKKHRISSGTESGPSQSNQPSSGSDMKRVTRSSSRAK